MFSPAFPRNRGPIRQGVRKHLDGLQTVLEVASGPGQHAIDLADVLGCRVQPTDVDPSALDSIDAWRHELGSTDVLEAKALDVDDEATWPGDHFDAVVAINFLHMVSEDTVERFFKLCDQVVPLAGRILVYDCFTYDGEHVAPSNEAFDASLRTRGGQVHAFETVIGFAEHWGFGAHIIDRLPANNQLVCWARQAP